MTNDRELLEQAAKAAGYEGWWMSDVYYISINGRWKEFDPLTDDGDALRLAVKLGLIVNCWNAARKTWVGLDDGETEVTELHDDDPYAATRRAIVRAAAAIGESL